MVHRTASSLGTLALALTIFATAGVAPAETGEQPPQQIDTEPSGAHIELWDAIEAAGRSNDWDEVKRLVQQIPGWRSSRAVERVLSHVPRVMPEPKKTRSQGSIAERRAEVEEMAARQRALFEAEAAKQHAGPDSGDESPKHSVEGRLPGPVSDIRPPKHPTDGKSPDAVLTVGAACAYPTIQAAVDAAATSGDVLWIHGTTFDESVNINSKSLILWGGLDSSCISLDGSRTLIDGSGTTGTTLEILGAYPVTVEMNLIDLTGGTNDADYGGGLEISGAAHEVILNEVDIYGNSSTYGGGVHLTDGAELFLRQSTRIGGNTAGRGGGIYVFGAGTTVFLDSAMIGSAVLGGNIATVLGGGIHLAHGRLEVGSLAGSGVVQLNQAENGGGVSAIGSSSVILSGSQSLISSNSANDTGGGAFISGSSTFRMDSGGVVYNVAGFEGAGVYGVTDGTIDVDSASCEGGQCARFVGNQSVYGYGGAISSWGQSAIRLQAATLHGNVANSFSSAILAINPTSLDLQSLMITGNHSETGYGTVYVATDWGMQMMGCTLADNTGNTTSPLFTVQFGQMSARGLIVWGNDGSVIVDPNGGGIFSLSESIDQFGAGGPAVDPLFLDPVGGDYHIAVDSPAVNHANDGPDVDIDLESRPMGGGFDAGADEATTRVGLNGAPCAYPNVTAAIAAAVAGDTVYISAGTYLERPGVIDQDLVLTAATPDCTAEDLTALPNATRIDGYGTSAFAGGLIEVVNNATVEMRRLRLLRGTASFGGNLFVDVGSTVNLHSVWVDFGTADTAGGGARVLGVLNLSGETVFWFNSADSGGAGSAYGGGVALSGPGAQLNLYDGASIGSADHSIPFGNVTETDGGGVWMGGGATMTMNDTSLVTKNGIGYTLRCDDGGGVFVTGVGSTLTVNAGASIRLNFAIDGGGVAAEDGAIVLVDGGSIHGNGASGVGGGIAAQNALTNPVTVTLTGGAEVSSNSLSESGSGGGVGVQEATEDTTILIDGAEISFNEAADFGGGLFNPIATITIRDSRLQGNEAGEGGGAIYTYGYGTTEILADTGPVTIIDNQSSGHGGAIYHAYSALTLQAVQGHSIVVDSNDATYSGGGVYATWSDLDISGDVQITNNTAYFGDGGGIYHELGGGVIEEVSGLRPLIAYNNTTAGNGGGVFLYQAGCDFRGAVIDSNSTTHGWGGGIYARTAGIDMVNTLVHNNRAETLSGGGLVLADGGQVAISGNKPACDPSTLPADTYCSEFRDNTAADSCAAIAIDNSGGSGTVSIGDTAFIGGSSGFGANICSFGANDNLSFTNCRMTGFTGGHAVQMAWPGNLSLDSCTLAGNSGALLVQEATASVSVDNSILWGNDNGSSIAAAVTGGCSIDQDGIAGMISDPLFATSARGDYHLDGASPAINQCPSGPMADLDNQPRYADDGSGDMGAFEAVPGAFSGIVELQPVRASTAGVTVAAYRAGASSSTASTTTDAAGSFTLELPAGSFDIVAEIGLYLSAMYVGATISPEETIALPTVTLLGGDTDDDGTVALVDVTFVASSFGSTTSPAADINATGTVDIVDVSATASNYNTSEPAPWP